MLDSLVTAYMVVVQMDDDHLGSRLIIASYFTNQMRPWMYSKPIESEFLGLYQINSVEQVLYTLFPSPTVTAD